MTEPVIQALITLGAPLNRRYEQDDVKKIVKDKAISANGSSDANLIKSIMKVRPVFDEYFKHNKDLGPFNTTRDGISDDFGGVKRSGLTDNVKGLDKKPDNGTGQELKPQPVALTYEGQTYSEKASSLAEVKDYAKELFDITEDFEIYSLDHGQRHIKLDRHFINMLKKPPADGFEYQMLVKKVDQPDDKPKPDNQEEAKMKMPETDPDVIGYEDMTAHIRDKIMPYVEQTKQMCTPGKF